MCFFLYAGELKTTVLFGTCPEVEMGLPVTSFVCVTVWPALGVSGGWAGL